MNLRPLAIVAATPLLFVLAGCSPHPGSGSWLSESGDADGLARLVVQFDGKAELFRADREDAAYRCFWAGDGKRTLRMRCATAANPDIEVRYRLDIGSNGRAGLYQADRLVTRFRKDPSGDGAARGK